jgi:hypothetical protein
VSNLAEVKEVSKVFLQKILNADKIKAIVLGHLFPMSALLIEELISQLVFVDKIMKVPLHDGYQEVAGTCQSQ